MAFNNPMPAVIEDFKDEVDEQFEEQALSLWDHLVKETFRNAYETGTLRFNWNAQYNKPDKSAEERPDPPEPNSMPAPSRPSLNGSLTDGDDIIYISNWTPYAGWINDGDGGQDPAHIVSKAIKGWRDNL